MEPIAAILHHKFFILASFACLFSFTCKTKAKSRISVELSDEGVNLASKAQYMQEIQFTLNTTLYAHVFLLRNHKLDL